MVPNTSTTKIVSSECLMVRIIFVVRPDRYKLAFKSFRRFWARIGQDLGRIFT